MPKRFSGEVRLTVSRQAGREDDYDVKVKAPGSAAHEGVSCLQPGYTELHGEEKALDEAARKYMAYLGTDPQPGLSQLVKQAAKDGDLFHVGRGKADRWPGGPSNTKTKKGR